LGEKAFPFNSKWLSAQKVFPGKPVTTWVRAPAITAQLPSDKLPLSRPPKDFSEKLGFSRDLGYNKDSVLVKKMEEG
jgi:hypothetical protein